MHFAGVTVEVDTAHRFEQPEGLSEPPQLQLGGARVVSLREGHDRLSVDGSHLPATTTIATSTNDRVLTC